MTTSVRFYFLLTLISAFAPAAGSAERWVHGNSEHFEMLSSASEKESRRILGDLEQFRENVLALFSAGAGREPHVTVVVFKSDSSFTPYKPLYQGKPREVGGYFVNGPDEVVIAMCLESDPDGLEDPTEIIFHEYLHLLLHTRGLRLPAWLDEGLAEVFSTFRTEGQFAEYGRPKQLYVDLLGGSALMPMERLLAIDQSSPEYNEEYRATMFYAQAWLFTHYLLCGADRKNGVRLSRFVERLDISKLTYDEAFREIFGSDFKGMAQTLRAYLDGGSYFQRKSPLKPIAESQLTVRPATAFERDLALLNLRWRVHQTEEVVRPLRALGEQQTDSPRPWELLGSMAAARGDREEALGHWQRAAKNNSLSAFVYLQLALEKVRTFDLANLDARLEPFEAFELQRWLDRALTLRPGYAEAVEALALAEARAPTLRIYGINLVQAAVPRLKEPDLTLLALAVIRWRANDIPTCQQILDVVIASSKASPRVKAAARILRLRINGASEAAKPAPVPAPAKKSSFLGPTGSILEGGAKTPPPPNPPRTFVDDLLGREAAAPEDVLPVKVNLSGAEVTPPPRKP